MEINNVDITWKELFGQIPDIRTSCYNQICIEREVIPIIFVPGFMGSRLIRTRDKVKLWDPDDAGFMLRKYGWLKDAARSRKALLIGPEFSDDYAEVSNYDEAHNKNLVSVTDKNRVKRGWGGVMWGTYQDLLINLQNHQWSEPICHCFEMPVHAFGYNWCASNDLSGKLLSREIDRIIDYYRCGPEGQVGGPYPRMCNYVILVTHSMGGLVARSACMLHGAKDKVLGVVHGVQPATGSPAAYWRMKAGFERPSAGPTKTYWDWLRNPIKMAKHHIMGTITAAILGTDGEEVTSLLGNMPGGLELLPNQHYIDNGGSSVWLCYPALSGEMKLPVQDVYNEIYLAKERVYRLVDPVWLGTTAVDPGPGEESLWMLYKKYLEQAKNFHTMLNISVHPRTYQFYGADLDSADKIVFSRKLYVHDHPHVHYDPVLINKGSFASYVDARDIMLTDSEGAAYVVMMGMPDGNGDGTVPVSSGNALKVGETNTKIIDKEAAPWFDIAHQDIYSAVVAQNFVFKCIKSLLYERIHEECAIPLCCQSR